MNKVLYLKKNYCYYYYYYYYYYDGYYNPH